MSRQSQTAAGRGRHRRRPRPRRAAVLEELHRRHPRRRLPADRERTEPAGRPGTGEAAQGEGRDRPPDPRRRPPAQPRGVEQQGRAARPHRLLRAPQLPLLPVGPPQRRPGRPRPATPPCTSTTPPTTRLYESLARRRERRPGGRRAGAEARSSSRASYHILRETADPRHDRRVRVHDEPGVRRAVDPAGLPDEGGRRRSPRGRSSTGRSTRPPWSPCGRSWRRSGPPGRATRRRTRRST